MQHIDAAGIYVQAAHIDGPAVARATAAFWTARGAYASTRSPHRIAPLDVARTGALGFWISSASPEWILVLDTERYRADGDLALHLHRSLGVEVVAYVLSESIGRAWLTWHRADAVQHEADPAVVRDLISSLPQAFSTIASEASEGPPASVEVVSFAGIGLCPAIETGYRGPALGTKEGRNLQYHNGKQLLASCSPELHDWLRTNPDITESFLSDLGRLSLTDVARRDFVISLEHELFAIEHPHYGKHARKALAEAAFRAGQHELFERAFASLPERLQVWELQRWLAVLGEEGAFEHALAAFVKLETSFTPDDKAWNNLCFVLVHLDASESLGDELDRYLALATERAPHNPFIFHNLACVRLRLGDSDAALACVEGAIGFGYPRLDLLRDDEDLALLWGTARWRDAWAALDEQAAQERKREEESSKAKVRIRKILEPGVGIEIESIGTLTLGMDEDEMFELTGEPPDSIDTAMNVLRFNHLDLTVALGAGGWRYIQHLTADTTTMLFGLDLGAVSPEEVVARAREVLGAEPMIENRDGYRAYRFMDAALELSHNPDKSPDRLSAVSLTESGQLRRNEADKAQAALVRAKEGQERENESQRECVQRLREYFDARDRALRMA